jgi:hypothetical protein
MLDGGFAGREIWGDWQRSRQHQALRQPGKS